MREFVGSLSVLRDFLEEIQRNRKNLVLFAEERAFFLQERRACELFLERRGETRGGIHGFTVILQKILVWFVRDFVNIL